MANPPCICLDVFVEAVCGKVDRYAWVVEHEAYARTGHVASCHHRTPSPKGYRFGTHPTAHRGLARILDDLFATAA